MLFYNSSVRITFIRLGLVVFLVPLVWSQNSLPAPQSTADTSRVTCGEKPPFSTHVVRSETFVAPDGKRRAKSKPARFIRSGPPATPALFASTTPACSLPTKARISK